TPRVASRPGASGFVTAFVPMPEGRWLVGSTVGTLFNPLQGVAIRDLEAPRSTTIRLDGGPGFADASTMVIAGAIGPGGRLGAVVAKATKGGVDEFQLALWDLATRKVVARRPVSDCGMGLDRCAFSPDGMFLAIGGDGSFQVLTVPGLTPRLAVNLESS